MKKYNLLPISILSVLSCILMLGSCSKSSSSDNNFVYGQVSDLEGNSYKTIAIGSQTWMAENLKSIKLNDGTAIPLVTDNSAWSNATGAARCYYANDSTSYKGNYGALYNWYTVQTGKLCPTGWHVPTDADWTKLASAVGLPDSVAGGSLKDGGYGMWVYPNYYATNATGFKAYPGGYRYYNGSFYNIGLSTNYWTATAYTNNTAYYRFLSCSNGKIGRDFYDKAFGFSIRCVKD